MKLDTRKTGFALISVLALVSVLVLLLGALIGTNRTAFGMLRYSQAQDRIDRTVSSVYSYCRFRLEHEYQWGKTDFSGSSKSWGNLELREVPGKGGDIQTVVGRDTANNTSFAVEICNNLRTDGEVATLKDINGEARRGGVPSGFCRLLIKVEGGGLLEGAEVMVRNPGLVGAVSLASDLLEIDARELDLLTRDPIKNQARSLGGTRLTGLQNFLEGRSRSLMETLGGNSPANISKKDPVVWSGSANQFRDNVGEGFQTRLPFKASHSTLNFQDQRFVDEARSLFDIPKVDLDDLLEVRTVDGNSKPVQSVPPGIYQIVQFSSNPSDYNSPPVRVLTRRAPASDLESLSGPVEQYWWEADPSAAGVTNDQVAAFVGADPSVGIRNESSTADPNSKYVSINSGGGAKVDLTNRRVVFDDAYNFEVDGDFSLFGHATDGNRDARDVNPAIYFGDPARIALAADFRVVGGSRVDPSREKGSLKATGRINLQGDISGSTTIAAKGDLTLAPGRFFDAEGNAEVNFALFSEKNISIVPPPIREQFDDRAVDLATGDVEGRLNISENTLRFTGLIYARENVKIDLQDTREELNTRRNLLLEGAVVAHKGQLRILNADDVEMVYNPQFVDRLLPNLTTTGRRRIEVTGWRVVKPSKIP